MDVKELRESLGIDDYLELVKEDKNCNGAYISFGQYMYLLENEIQELKKQYCERTDCSGRIGNSKKLERLEMENRNLRRAIKKLLNNEDIGTGLMNTLYGYGLFNKQDNN